jgi:hypothetical protein
VLENGRVTNQKLGFHKTILFIRLSRIVKKKSAQFYWNYRLFPLTVVSREHCRRFLDPAEQYLQRAMFAFFRQEPEMPDTIRAIEEEIGKIEARIQALKGEACGTDEERKVKEATLSLLKQVIKDLRKQQKKLARGAGAEESS